MAEYIEREAAITKIREEGVYGSGYSNEEREDNVVDMIESIPAADVRPVVRGHIEEDENTYLYCSECNCDITLAAYETPNGNLILRPNFCPNCGADMREEHDD